MKDTLPHWHVKYHPSSPERDYTSYRADDVLSAARDELTSLSDTAHDMITAYGEDGKFEEAYYSFCTADRCTTLALKAKNLLRQTASDPSQRAPHYRNEPPRGPKWMTAVRHLIDQINGQSDLSIWQCERDICRPGAWVATVDGTVGPRKFSADNHRDALNCFRESVENWADESDAQYGPDGSDRATVDSIFSDLATYTNDLNINFSINANDGSYCLFFLSFDRDEEPTDND